jgi:hypothetical protein
MICVNSLILKLTLPSSAVICDMGAASAGYRREAVGRDDGYSDTRRSRCVLEVDTNLALHDRICMEYTLYNLYIEDDRERDMETGDDKE